VAGFVVMKRAPGAGAAPAVDGSITAGVLTFWLIVPLLLAAAIS
jgi:hypothetical protein